MLIVEIIVTVLITGGFTFISKKLDKLEEKVDVLEEDVLRLSINIEKRAEVRQRSQPID